jgi:hypothetical protein
MNHPEHILRTLDSHLVKPTRLILYGRAALALGFPDPPPHFHSTMDVDAILPEVEMAAIEADDSFWNAIEKTNEQLEPSGLYLTHLFVDSQVILQPDWLEHLVPVRLPDLSFLQLYRPGTGDLILTKMMRVDPQDRSDIEFLRQSAQLNAKELDTLFQNARVPVIPEIQQAFEANQAWLNSKTG